MDFIHCVDHYGNPKDVPRDKFVFRVSVYGVLAEEGRVLMVQEKWGKLWEFPGGGVKVAEPICEALQREFREETGLKITIGDLITFLEDYFWAEDRQEGWHSIRFIYRVKRASGRLKRDGNNDDIIKAELLRDSEITRTNTKPPIYQLYASFVKK